MENQLQKNNHFLEKSSSLNRWNHAEITLIWKRPLKWSKLNFYTKFAIQQDFKGKRRTNTRLLLRPFLSWWIGKDQSLGNRFLRESEVNLIFHRQKNSWFIFQIIQPRQLISGFYGPFRTRSNPRSEVTLRFNPELEWWPLYSFSRIKIVLKSFELETRSFLESTVKL